MSKSLFLDFIAIFVSSEHDRVELSKDFGPSFFQNPLSSCRDI
jgi:hypothetical protein